MSDVALLCERIGKRYSIGARLAGYRTLREVVSSAASSRLHRRHGRAEETIWALRDVSFEIRSGEAVGIIGRNGAGKSTLLRLLSRITAPSEGRAEVFGRVGSLLEVGTGFHPELTGRENVLLNGAILGMKRAEILARFDEIVAFAEVERFLDTPVKHYSSGMYMRLAFAVAAHLETEILLVDEVLAVGDVEFQRKCLGKMRHVSREQGRTVLFVSHNIAAVNELCAAAVWLAQGRLVMNGSTQDVTARYLAADAKGSSRASYPERPNEKLTFTNIQVLDQERRESTCIDVRYPFLIVLDYVITTKLRGVEMAVRIKTHDGLAVCTTLLSGDGGEASDDRDPGRYQARIGIPGRFLMPGMYTLVVGAFIPNMQMYDVHDNVLRFEVVDTGTGLAKYGNYRELGVALVAASWETERLSDRTVEPT